MPAIFLVYSKTISTNIHIDNKLRYASVSSSSTGHVETLRVLITRPSKLEQQAGRARLTAYG